ncbi:MAG: AraC family transcriptional regulator [Novosphingobium sp.]|nr:AraC family transcriptional regulator [Novosphingobium sp.]
MAILTDLLESVRLVAAWPRMIDLRGEAVLQFDATHRVTLHLVLGGSTKVQACDGAFDRALCEGQYLFVPPGYAQLVGGASRHPQRLPAISPDDRIPALRFGDGPITCTLLSAELELDHARLDTIARIMPEVKRHVPDGAPTIFPLPEMLSVRGLKQTGLLAGGHALFRCAAEAMFVNSVREHISSGTAEASTSSDVRAAPVAAALRLMYRRPEHGWTLGELASACGVSRSVLASAFSRQVGTTPMAFLARVRMMRAETLLREDRLALAPIAALCGYRSETAFNRAFSIHAGVSPGAWRRAMRNPRRTFAQA